MKIIGREKLDAIKGKSEDIDRWISIWLTELRQNKWFNQTELKQHYPRAKTTAATFSFLVPESRYIIKVNFHFDQSIALISAVSVGKNP